MEPDVFWTLIERIDRTHLETGDEDAAVAPLIAAVSALIEPEIEGFEEQLAQALYALDSRAHEASSGESSGSDDCFLYARCFVVARGRKHYEVVLDDPTRMPKTLEEWCESLLAVAQKAWATRTGGDPEAWGFTPSVSYESGSNTDKWT